MVSVGVVSQGYEKQQEEECRRKGQLRVMMVLVVALCM